MQRPLTHDIVTGNFRNPRYFLSSSAMLPGVFSLSHLCVNCQMLTARAKSQGHRKAIHDEGSDELCCHGNAIPNSDHETWY